MINGEKIGVGIITCNRSTLLKKLYDSITTLHNVLDEIVIVNDGKKIENSYNYTDLITNTTNLGVAKSKNKAFEALLESKCDHMFLIEDDMLIKDPNVFEKYIKTSKVTGIQHLMFGYHGPANKGGVSKGTPQPKLVVKYDDDISIALNEHCVGSFCYYSKKCIDDVGLIDENFKNAFDHVSHSYDLALKGYSTPYWWWADVWDSNDYIEEQVCSEESSSIKTPERMEEWSNNIQESMQYFKSKYGVLPFGVGGVDCQSTNKVFEFLKSIKP